MIKIAFDNGNRMVYTSSELQEAKAYVLDEATTPVNIYKIYTQAKCKVLHVSRYRDQIGVWLGTFCVLAESTTNRDSLRFREVNLDITVSEL